MRRLARALLPFVVLMAFAAPAVAAPPTVGRPTTTTTTPAPTTPSVTSSNPPPSSQVTCSSQNDGVHLAWTTVTGAVSYNIYRSTNGGAAILLANVATSSYVDHTTAPGNSYTYTVKAVNNGNHEFMTVGTCTASSIPFFPTSLAIALGSLALLAAIPIAMVARRR